MKKTGRIRFITFAQRTDPCVGLYSKFMTAFVKSYRDAPDNINVTVQGNVSGLGKKLGHRSAPESVFLGTDTAMLQEIDRETMEPLGPSKSHGELHPNIKGPLGPAHVYIDNETGEYFSFNIEPGGKPTSTYRVFRVDAKGKTIILATFNATVAYIHSFFLSPNYVVLCLPVAHMDGVKILWHRSFAGAFRPFDENEPTRRMVVDRHHGKGVVAKFRSEALFFFHSSNAFEDDEGNVICELVSFRDRAILTRSIMMS
jgi:torulene dioxygenase